jgi:hypothetical protein
MFTGNHRLVATRQVTKVEHHHGNPAVMALRDNLSEALMPPLTQLHHLIQIVLHEPAACGCKCASLHIKGKYSAFIPDKPGEQKGVVPVPGSRIDCHLAGL